MDLQQMLKEVHQYDENVIVAEFKNGVGVAYEKGQDGVVYAPLRQEIWGVDFDVLNIDTGEPQYGSLSEGIVDALEDFSQRSYQTRLEQKIQDQFGKVVDELELIPHTKRDWKHIGTSLAAGLLAPTMLVTVPLLYAYVAATKDRSGNEGDLGIIALALAPVVLPAVGIKELTNPSPKYFQMGKADVAITKNKGNLPAINFIQGDLNQFYSMGVCFPSGDVGTITLNEHHMGGSYDLDKGVNDYNNATPFLNISSDVNREMNRLLEERAGFSTICKEFTSQLNKENQEALLKSIGFLA